jgi:2-(1,2-epoxy-1,2-dihydrophenyl)acetyl-CoA isomerase
MPEGGAPIRDLVGDLYPALADGRVDDVMRLLSPEFVVSATPGLPMGLGGRHEGPEAAWKAFWRAIGQSFSISLDSQEWIDCGDGRLLVLGRYVGRALSGGELDAAFVHLWAAEDGRLTYLWHLTDSALWAQALWQKGSGG